MKRILDITKTVKGILEEQPETRDDDNLLWLEAIRETAYQRDCVYVLDWSISGIMRNIGTLGFPPFGTVSRARRKLQKKYPELKGTKRIQRERAKQEKKFEEFARNGISI